MAEEEARDRGQYLHRDNIVVPKKERGGAMTEKKSRGEEKLF